MHAIRKALGTLAVSGLLATGMVTLHAAVTTTSAAAISATQMRTMDGPWRRRNVAWSRAFSRAFNRAFARARSRSHAANTNGPAQQTVNIVLDRDDLTGLITPVTTTTTGTTHMP
jgi:hypothetical protein